MENCIQMEGVQDYKIVDSYFSILMSVPSAFPNKSNKIDESNFQKRTSEIVLKYWFEKHWMYFFGFSFDDCYFGVKEAMIMKNDHPENVGR